MFEFHTPGLHNVYAADGSTFKGFLSLHPVLQSVRLALDPLHRPPYSNNILYHSNNGVGVGGWGEGRAAVLTVHLSYTLRHMLIWSRFTRVFTCRSGLVGSDSCSLSPLRGTVLHSCLLLLHALYIFVRVRFFLRVFFPRNLIRRETGGVFLSLLPRSDEAHEPDTSQMAITMNNGV